MLVKSKGGLYIGTSNVVLPGKKSTFPKAFKIKSRLNYYSSLFTSVEVNSSFYKVPMYSTCEKWANDVGDDFRFTIKLWKQISHVKELVFNVTDIDLFLKRTEAFRDKKGCLLLQFPGKITFDYFNKVEEILSFISQSAFAFDWQKAVEFRDASWYTGEAFEMLDEYNASMVLHDNPKAKSEVLNKKAGVLYLRFHGPNGDYRDSYSLGFSKDRTELIKEWRKKGKDVYAYFNNTAGDAFINARTLQELNEIYNP